MTYNKLLTHKCDIYHLKSRPRNGSFGVPEKDRQKETYYSDVPDVRNQRCYLTEKSQSIVQSEPNNTIVQIYLAHFPIDSDIQTNSKVIWEGIELKAQKPRKIKNHHIEVSLVRRDNL